MRVLMPFTGDSVGGSHRAALLLASQLEHQGIEVVVGVHEVGSLVPELERLERTWIKMPTVRYPCIACSAHRQRHEIRRTESALSHVINALSINIVHTNDQRMHMSWLAPSQTASVAHVWHQRSTLAPQRVGWYARRIPSYARNASAIATVSNYCRDGFPRDLRSKIRVIADPVACTPDPVRTANAREEMLAATNAPPEAKIVGWIGNWSMTKRPFVMIDVARRVLRKASWPTAFVMIGKTQPRMLRRSQVRIAKHGLGDHLAIFGPRFPIDDHVAALDVLVAPAVREGLGLTLIEAMQANTAVVAADHGGHREIITDRDTGRLVAADDIEAFANTVCHVIEDDAESSHMVRRALLHAREKYSPANHAREVVLMYNHVRDNRI